MRKTLSQLTLAIPVAMLFACSSAQDGSTTQPRPACTLASFPELPDVTITTVTEESEYAPHCRVAGVIGTEIPIHEYLAEAFGRVLFRRLLAGDPVGRVIYDFRHELLRRRNPLGLVYVPYCYADLRLAPN